MTVLKDNEVPIVIENGCYTHRQTEEDVADSIASTKLYFGITTLCTLLSELEIISTSEDPHVEHDEVRSIANSAI